MLPGHAATSSDKKARLNNYVFLRTIREGTFGKVKLARHLPTGTEVAIKVIRKNQQSSTNIKKLSHESQSLQVLNHPNIIKLFEVIDTKEMLFLVMERVSKGDMSDYIQTYGRMTEEEARRKFRQLVSALHYCHQKGIVHRDLKPENVLFDSEMNIKLTDFGLSNMFIGRKLSSYCGTICYTAPEILQQQDSNGPPVDVWSLGVVFYIMTNGRLPFWADDFSAVKQQILRGRYPIPRHLSSGCQKLLNKMMTFDPSKRATLEDIMNDPWVNMGQEKLRPYRELPCEKRDPWAIEVMMNMGFKLNKIQHSLKRKKYDNLMTTYLILTSTKSKAEGHTIAASSVPSIDPQSHRSFPTFEVQPEVSVPKVRHSCNEPVFPTRFCKANQRPEQPRHAGKPDGATPASPSGPSQRQWGAAGRFLNFIRLFCFCLSSKNQHVRHNKVKPI